jgi:hypothetical protein
MTSVRSAAFLLIMSTFLCQSCKIYRFTDASINPNIKSVSVQTFPNLAPIQVPSLSQVFTDKLKTKFLRESNLTVLSNGGDIDFNGSIINYSIDPAAVTQTETVAQNRLTISIRVEYTDRLDPNKSFSQVFSDNEVYASAEDISTVENRLIDIITDKLVQSIFNRAFANW